MSICKLLPPFSTPHALHTKFEPPWQSRRRPRSGRAACGAVRRIGQTAKRVCPEGVRARRGAPESTTTFSSPGRKPGGCPPSHLRLTQPRPARGGYTPTPAYQPRSLAPIIAYQPRPLAPIIAYQPRSLAPIIAYQPRPFPPMNFTAPAPHGALYSQIVNRQLSIVNPMAGRMSAKGCTSPRPVSTNEFHPSPALKIPRKRRRASGACCRGGCRCAS